MIHRRRRLACRPQAVSAGVVDVASLFDVVGMQTIEILRPFTLADLRRLGLTRQRLRTLIRHGDIRRVVSGVYAPTALGDSLEVRAQAVALVLGDGHVACDRTAAWLHGISIYPYAEHDSWPEVEMCVGPGRSASTSDGIGGHRRTLLPSEVMDLHGVPVTTPLRTAVDLACILERRDAMAALDAFRRMHGLNRTDLVQLARRRFAGRRGVIQARFLIEHSDPRAESHRESWARIAIIDAGLPTPEPQVWIVVDGVPTYRLDLAYRRKRIAIEYDGFDAHEADEESVRVTEDRRVWLRDNGWTVIVIRNGDFTGARLDRWIGELVRALRPTFTNRRALERGARVREF